MTAPINNDPVCHECGAVVPQIEELQQSIVSLSRMLSRKEGTISKLRSDSDRQDPELVEQALEIAQYWKQLLAPRTRELKGPRVENTYARLKGDGTGKPYTVEDLKQAVYGYYCRQYVVDGKRQYEGRPDQRHIDLELIMRDPKHVDAGLSFARQDAGYDVELIHKGSRQARICDCGHPEVDHLRPDLALELGLIDEEAPGRASIPREPCAHKDCDCYTFDTIQRALTEQIEEIRHAPKPITPPQQQLRLIS